MTSFIKPPLSGRNDQIDTLRAIACIGLVSFHVVGSPSSGLELSSNHWLARLNLALVDLRMPLFSFLSGMVFPVPTGAPLPQIRAKARRLLLPMATVGTLFWLTRDLMGYVQQPLYKIFFLPFAHFWFLQATFLIMALCLVAATICGGRDKLAIGILGFAGAALYISPFRLDMNVFSIINAWKLAPFFSVGFLAARMMPWRRSPAQRIVGITGLLAAVTFGFILAWDLIDFEPEVRRAVSVALGLVFCILLYVTKPNHPWLAWVGRQSYPIYLFHVFFTAGTIMAIDYVAPGTPPLVLFFAALSTGLLGPTALSKILILHPVTALCFLGLRRRRRVREANPIAASSC